MEPNISIGCVSNVYSRQMHFLKAGDIEYGHTHPFDHISLLAYGSTLCLLDGKSTEFKAPAMIFVAKDKLHEFVALEDNTLIYCIHALRMGENIEDIIDPSMIPAGGSATDIALPVTN